MEIKRDEIAAALERAPALKPLLTRFARAAAKGRTLPQTFTAKDLDYEAQFLLERLFLCPTARDARGTVNGILLPPLREPAAWKGVIDLLLTEGERRPKVESVDDFFQKLLWRDPDGEEMILRMRQTPEVVRYPEKTESGSR